MEIPFTLLLYLSTASLRWCINPTKSLTDVERVERPTPIAELHRIRHGKVDYVSKITLKRLMVEQFNSVTEIQTELKQDFYEELIFYLKSQC